jgi:hypothetical protein
VDIFSLPARVNRRLRTAAYSLKVDWSTLRLAYAVARKARVDPGRRPVIFFNASTRIRGHSLNAAFSLLGAWALRLQGVPVIHFVCNRGMSRCLQGTDQDDVYRSMPCGLCLRQSRVNYAGARQEKFGYEMNFSLAEALAGLNVDALVQFEQPFEETTLPLGQMVLPSIRWRLRRLTLPDDEPTRYLYREFILSAWNVLHQFDLLLRRVKDPQAVVLFNGQTFPEAAVRWLAAKRGLRAITHEVSMAPFSAFFTEGEATALPMPIPPDFELSPAQEARLDALMLSRFEGKVSMAGIRFFPEMKGLDESFLQKAAGFKQIVPIFTNVIFDTTQQHSNAFFPSMFAWLDAVLGIIQWHPETLFVLRAHPDEDRPGKVSRESVAMWVERTGAVNLPNLVFVKPGEYISSYELIRRSKFVVIYASTIGLEASIMGKAVLCAGSARFTHFNTMVFPANREEYLSRLEEFLSAGEVEALPEHIRNARRFFYFHNYRASLTFGDFIEPARLRGFVKWKKFPLEKLSPQASPAVQALVEGILEEGDFMLKEPKP